MKTKELIEMLESETAKYTELRNFYHNELKKYGLDDDTYRLREQCSRVLSGLSVTITELKNLEALRQEEMNNL